MEDLILNLHCTSSVIYQRRWYFIITKLLVNYWEPGDHSRSMLQKGNKYAGNPVGTHNPHGTQLNDWFNTPWDQCLQNIRLVSLYMLACKCMH